MKRLKRLFGIYTEADLVHFGNVMYNKEKTLSAGVTDADLQNFKEING